MIRLIVYVQTRAMLPLTANFVLIDRTGGMAAGREFGYVARPTSDAKRPSLPNITRP